MLQLYDTLTRTVKPLQAEDGNRYRFYCCGPTVYGPAHIGNFRTFVINDVLRRVLEIAGMNPLYVRNITDVEDKTIRQSQEEGVPLKSFTEKWTQHFHEDCATLNMISPDIEPRATEHIGEQIDLIEKLIAGGHAYKAQDGSVYYKVDSFEDYGKLSHLDREALQSQKTTSGGSANLADEYDRESIADFALWKAHKPEDGENYWPSPWGNGRPGWHLECSAMSMKYLGETFDLHSGGEDLCFPHHENEIAQSEAVTGKTFSRHWFHGVHLLVEGKKMSKSLGNFFTLRDLLEKRHSPMSIRYALLTAHYRQQLNFTFNGLHAAESALGKIEKSVAQLLATAGLDKAEFPSFQQAPFAEDWGHFAKAWNALCEDLNVPEALGAIFSGLNELDKSDISATETKAELKALGTLTYALGLNLFAQEKESAEIPDEIKALAEKRWEAKQAKDWAAADTLRDQLKAEGWEIKDRRDGYDLEAIR